MEPELERNRPSKSQRPSTTPQRKEAPPEPAHQPIRTNVQFERRTYSREVCTTLGVILLSLGFLGMVVDDLLGLHLSYIHNLIHMASGVLAIWFGVHAEVGAKRISYLLGAAFTIFGILGFVAGVHGTASVGKISEDNFLWVISPEKLELGSNDHIIHLLVGLVFLAGGLIMFKRRRLEPSKT